MEGERHQIDDSSKAWQAYVAVSELMLTPFGTLWGVAWRDTTGLTGEDMLLIATGRRVVERWKKLETSVDGTGPSAETESAARPGEEVNVSFPDLGFRLSLTPLGERPATEESIAEQYARTLRVASGLMIKRTRTPDPDRILEHIADQAGQMTAELQRQIGSGRIPQISRDASWARLPEFERYGVCARLCLLPDPDEETGGS